MPVDPLGGPWERGDVKLAGSRETNNQWRRNVVEDMAMKAPTPTIGVLELADSSINFAVRPWVKTGDYWAVFFDTQEKMKKRFDAEEISIPFPQRDVHLHKVA